MKVLGPICGPNSGSMQKNRPNKLPRKISSERGWVRRAAWASK